MKTLVQKIRGVFGSMRTAPGESPHQGARRGLRIGIVLLVLAVIVVLLRLTVLRPPRVSVATVQRGNVAAEVEGSGTVTADALANIAAKITGRVDHVFVEEGDSVSKNQIVATLDQDGLRHQVAVAQARLDAARVSAEQRQREWIREKKLVVSGSVGVEEAQQYRERNAVAQSAVRVAAAELGKATYELSLAQIPALSDGIVTQRWVVPGASVVAGQPMFTIADTHLIYVDTFVDQNVTGRIRKGETATVMLRGREHQPLPGHVLRIRPRADAATEETVAEVSFSIPADQFQLGQWANVYIRTGEAKDALVVPQMALTPMGNALFVWVVGADHTLHRIRVTVLARSPRSSKVAVAGDDLHAGDRVVLMPMGLKPGESVHPEPVKAAMPMGTSMGMGMAQ
ncbi:MAG: efflux RND transporter periplasmic adaptor subunit [Rhodanobacter sp.]|nr:MAG: efflux RND transporter periplasmic adaptor subunit [Rhodanobacter sp.]TAL99479.1 MAG: efflux RND transporter periplasmic adaptor subunit [Rhodanobacter sp.]TAM40943.1 MAG: efflux RND transporter periplasmic adaptor subunit [Rhodanobacter sp.]TAN25657.1 MAG: efflux RND transporter periplasmic adaptor subunit [Rhodanobacter sp.]